MPCGMYTRDKEGACLAGSLDPPLKPFSPPVIAVARYQTSGFAGSPS